MAAKSIGTGRMVIDGKDLGELRDVKLPVPPTTSDLVSFVLQRNFVMQCQIEAVAADILLRASRAMMLYMARRTMTKRGFRRWRARHWRKESL